MSQTNSREEQPREEQPNGIFTIGQQVIAEGDDGIERWGVINSIENYTITKTDGVNLYRNKVRPVEGNEVRPGNNVNYKICGRSKRGILASINYLVSFANNEERPIPHRRIRLAGAEQPRAEQPTGIFTNGQQVEIMDNEGQGELGTVIHLETYTIRWEDRQHTRNPLQVRREGEIVDTEGILVRKGLPPGSRVEFKLGNSWRNVLRGTIVSNNYMVVPVGPGRMREIPGTCLRLSKKTK